ncbi:hypothetical protein HPP92_018156 [Vanilla planifolia]|uniref:Uncharacterized protein n=1 Tax=Vanilla planifolia TaxID=51239 RepID=A0A835Q9D4_VANPL|nr:hypothetical protein HPP92_018156 [Vanilla planifolia]
MRMQKSHLTCWEAENFWISTNELSRPDISVQKSSPRGNEDPSQMKLWASHHSFNLKSVQILSDMPAKMLQKTFWFIVTDVDDGIHSVEMQECEINQECFDIDPKSLVENDVEIFYSSIEVRDAQRLRRDGMVKKSCPNSGAGLVETSEKAGSGGKDIDIAESNVQFSMKWQGNWTAPSCAAKFAQKGLYWQFILFFGDSSSDLSQFIIDANHAVKTAGFNSRGDGEPRRVYGEHGQIERPEQDRFLPSLTSAGLWKKPFRASANTESPGRQKTVQGCVSRFIISSSQAGDNKIYKGERWLSVKRKQWDFKLQTNLVAAHKEEGSDAATKFFLPKMKIHIHLI